MAKEFDIYLEPLVRQCDLIVYSLPYRNSLRVETHLILQCCLESYLLQKFIAVQTGSALSAHIDEMVKACYERLDAETVLIADVSLSKEIYSTDMLPDDIAFLAETIGTLTQSFTEAGNSVLIDASSVTILPEKLACMDDHRIELAAVLNDVLKTCIETVHGGVLFSSQMPQANAEGFIAAENSAVMASALADLCFQVYSTASCAVRFAAESLDAMLKKSVGTTESGTVIGARTAGEHMEKTEAFEAALKILSGITATLIQFVSAGDPFSLCVDISAGASIARARPLASLDDIELSTIIPSCTVLKSFA